MIQFADFEAERKIGRIGSLATASKLDVTTLAQMLEGNVGTKDFRIRMLAVEHPAHRTKREKRREEKRREEKRREDKQTDA